MAAAPPTPPPPEPPAPPEPSIGIATRLPVPRFAALHSDNVNMRVGPGTNFPIEWNYQRRDLPVQIVGENQLWRRIRDPDGTEGWVSSANLSPRRSVVVRGEERALRVRPEPEAPPVARLRPGVIGRLRRCDADSPWCEVQVGEHRGYLRRTEVWGVSADEVIN